MSETLEGIFDLGDFALRSDATLPQATLVYKTHGQLNAERSNAIFYLTPFPAHHGDIEWPIGSGRALDPDKYFIIVMDQLGNGLSSSGTHGRLRPQPGRCAVHRCRNRGTFGIMSSCLQHRTKSAK
jgi:homoserine acetyltransferase